MINRLVKECINENGEKVYKMVTHDIDVIAKATGGLAPTIIYMHNNQDVTDDIRQIRFSARSPYSYIEDYDEFQTMLYHKEQKAINDLYDSISLRPKNMTPGEQTLWSFGILLLMTIPLLVAMFILN
ncbi:MAG: sodium:proton antiporter [Lysinibacillus sp.]|nr:sodium:proton antiporter [Lysinibacillus sp.]